MHFILSVFQQTLIKRTLKVMSICNKAHQQMPGLSRYLHLTSQNKTSRYHSATCFNLSVYHNLKNCVLSVYLARSYTLKKIYPKVWRAGWITIFKIMNLVTRKCMQVSNNNVHVTMDVD